MRSLFSENRLANILIVLRRSPGVTIERMAELLNVSERSVRNDIKQLNKEMKTFALIDQYQGQCLFRVFQEKEFRAYYSKLIQDGEFMNSPRYRMDYIFGKLMRASEPVLTDELAYEMNVGRTTMVSDLQKLRAEIQEYQLSIIGKASQGLSLCGNEMDIRRYVMDKNFHIVYKDYPMDEDVLAIVEKTIEEHSLENKVKENLRNFLILMLDRFLMGHYIGELTNQYYNLTAKVEYQWFDAMLNEIQKQLHVNIPAEERLYAFLPIVGMRTPADVTKMHQIALDDEVRYLMQEIILKIKLEMDITIQSGEFTEEFLYHLMFMLNRLTFKVRLKNPLLADIQSKYPLACQMADIAAEVVEEEYHLEVSEEEKGFLASYFGVFLERPKAEEKEFQIAVVCGTGRVTAKLVAVQLRKILDSTTTLDIYSDEAVTSEILNRYDMILSTVQLPCPCVKPVIRINEIFDEREILSKIERARYWDDVEVPLMDNNWFVMTGLLDESRFFFLEEVETYEDALEQMVTRLVGEGQLDEGFSERLKAREEKGTMVFDKSIAIPHTIQKADDRMVLAIGILKNAVIKNGQKIQLIFLMGLPEKAEDEDRFLLRMYDELMTIATDNELLKKITKATTYPELLRALYKEKNKR